MIYNKNESSLKIKNELIVIRKKCLLRYYVSNGHVEECPSTTCYPELRFGKTYTYVWAPK